MMNYTVGSVLIVRRAVTRTLTMLVMIALSLCFCTSILWAETRWTPLVNLSAVSDDNILFSVFDPEDDYIYLIEPGIKYDYDQERTNFYMDGRAELRRYQDNDDLDDEIYRFKLGGDTALSERFNLKGRYQLISDTTLDSELDEIGRTFIREDRISHNASLAPSYQFSETTSVGLSASYRNVAYDSDEFVDYMSWDVGLPIRWRLATQVDTVYIAPGYNYRDSDSNTSNTYKFRVGWDREATERLSVKSSLGVRYTELEQYTTENGTRVTVSSENWNGVGNIDFIYDFERGRLNFKLGHDLRNSASGDQVNVSKFIVGFIYNFTERSGVNLSARYLYTQDEDDTDDDTSEFIQAGSELFYNITENHQIFASYRYSQDDQDSRSGTDVDGNPLPTRAERNRVWVGVRLNFPI